VGCLDAGRGLAAHFNTVAGLIGSGGRICLRNWGCLVNGWKCRRWTFILWGLLSILEDILLVLESRALE
jgi:hypothetical protein